MTHYQEEKLLNENLDDLKVRSPSKYAEIERDLHLIRLKSDLAVAGSPIGLRRMERLH
jgi:hypothetical protein